MAPDKPTDLTEIAQSTSPVNDEDVRVAILVRLAKKARSLAYAVDRKERYDELVKRRSFKLMEPTKRARALRRMITADKETDVISAEIHQLQEKLQKLG